ncbi:acetyl-CoA acetyltransferase [Polymorphobacter glacialis]|uniref:Acetyl-CoA acetyltransferase n=1 Tax=Sandarakinorhabdus glacialis TaxID=1614636 RepID=A0A916ZWV2_9SPHN|nr:acetyl-CoA acetyltransferase [Polymorphobacter glacialis]GGE16818.1 acetyl-CoA acetyltransferase [Polymorphobacter glacialis]
MALPADRTPVIIGVGEFVDRPTDPAAALEPLALMEAAIRAADADAGGSFLDRIDSLDVINLVSWRYDRVASRLAERLGIVPARASYGVAGGETPTTRIHEAALRIMNGNSLVAVVTGGEATNAVAKAKAAGIALEWTPPAASPENPIIASDHVTPLAIRHGIAQPVHIYPLYENAAAAAWGQTPAEALAESGQIWSGYAGVAATNPNSWSKTAFTADQITTPTPDNRIITWPYTKRMVANPAVNQAAAVLLTNLELARAAGIPEDRIVYIHGGASAAEPMDYLARDQFTHSVAQDAVLAAALRLAPEGGFDRRELYSCFPIVPKMARRQLGLDADAPFTVTGGLSFFGAPLNTYMTHAVCAMVRSLRKTPSKGALIYGQGGYVTKHHALVVGSFPPEPSSLVTPHDVQDEAEAMRGPIPELDLMYEGEARVETFAIVANRDGTPAYGSVIGRTPDGTRVFARVAANDEDTLALLLDTTRSPIGTGGVVSVTDDGLQRWEA